jgi:hypothetical protein
VQIVTRAIIGRLGTLVALGGALLATAGCGDLARTGRSPAFLIIDNLQARQGLTGTLSATLLSDVQTIVDGNPTIVNDFGVATVRLGLKNPGTPGGTPTSPGPLNQITINRYRVVFTRTDGRNTPGVDVPFGFDGAVTATIQDTASQVAFQIVSHAMKLEPPLLGLAGGGGQMFIHTIAEVTFYGYDQAGNEVSASGFISVNFGDFADP